MTRKSAQRRKYRSTMYRVVFDSVPVKVGVLFLFTFLFMQPIAPAFADEVVTEDLEASVEVVEDQPEQEVEVTPDDQKIQTDTVDESVSEVEESDVPVSTEVVIEQTISEVSEEANTQIDEVSTEIVLVPDDVVSAETAHNGTTTQQNDQAAPQNGVQEEIIDETTDTEVLEGPLNEAAAGDEVIVEEDEEVEEDEGEDTTSSSTGAVLIVDHNANQLEFNKDHCASVGDGAFYCSDPRSDEVFKEDGVFAAPDADGDMEIFVRVRGEATQLTSNNIDDAAPYYDALSERIVWHANINDRFQIMSYDMKTNEETQLTDTSYNNMEPVAYGLITMYQAWVDNNWEIMLHDGEKPERLTENDHHDVSPSIRGDHVVWQSQFADGWQVAVYNQDTQQIDYVRSQGGAKVENPRFVLVYDSTNDAGDVQTVGYDFGSKQSFTLNNIPAELPEELPDPDQTGETRALIQNKGSIRGTELEEKNPVPTQNNSTSTPDFPEGVEDVDLTTSSSTPVIASTTPILIEDVVIPVFETAPQSPEISHIEDIVIPPVSPASTTEIR